MNTDALAKHYDHLTPWERLPLIVAASARSDDVEVDRLARSAPRRAFQVPDYRGLAEGLAALVVEYLLKQLDLAASYWWGATLGEPEPLPGGRKAHRWQQERLAALAKWLAYQFVVRADGWKQLCAELSIDPDVLLRELPGFATLRRMEEEARRVAFNAEEALTYLRELFERRPPGGNEPSGIRYEYHIDTGADVARSMREFLQKRLDAWRERAR